jgi:hypothetical protein
MQPRKGIIIQDILYKTDKLHLVPEWLHAGAVNQFLLIELYGQVSVIYVWHWTPLNPPSAPIMGGH